MHEVIRAPKGLAPLLSTYEYVDEWGKMTEGVIDINRRDKIEKLVLRPEKVDDL